MSSSASSRGNARLRAVFARRADGTALVPYMMAGDPSPESTVGIMHALVAAGADVIELGVPFSDPMADGGVIQAAAERALRHGVSLAQVLDNVATFRQTDTTTPVVLMGYANPVEAMGHAAFAERAGAAGVDGVLIVDYPPEEARGFAEALDAHGIDPILLLAPTSTDARMAEVGRIARGYIYYVSLKGVTGAGHLDLDDVARQVTRVRQHVGVPVAVGFGIRDAASAVAIGAVADAVVIGSRLVQAIEAAVADKPNDQWPQAAAQGAGDWLRTIRQALDTSGT